MNLALRLLPYLLSPVRRLTPGTSGVVCPTWQFVPDYVVWPISLHIVPDRGAFVRNVSEAT